MSDCLLGIDLGTTSVKAGVFSPDGNRLAGFGAPYPTVRKEGGVCEQDPEDWIRLIDSALSQFREAGLSSRIISGALTSQVNTHVFVDREGTPLLPAILWQDTRAAAEARELDAQLSDKDKIALLGAPIPIDASHPLARMLWVQRHHPDVWESTEHVLLPKDYALFRMTGELATDPLSNIGLVGVQGTFVSEILDLVSGAADRMAPIHGLTEITGQTADGVGMATATMDGWVGLLGAGCCEEGAFAYLGGTSEILGAASQTVTNEPGIVVFAEAESLKFHAGPTQSGGASQQWFCDAAGLEISGLIDLVANSKRRLPVPLFLPQLAGERAPIWNAGLRGAFLGLESGMEQSDLARAVYEGVALSARHVMEALQSSTGLQPDTLMCGGGGFKSDPWAQIRADVLGKRLVRPVVNEPGVVGAACIAAVSSGLQSSLSDAHVPFAKVDRIWEPDHSMRHYYDDLFGVYLDALQANESIGLRLSKLPSRQQDQDGV